MLNWTKICRTCKEIKVAPEFHKDQRKSDGLSIECIKCSDLVLIHTHHVTTGNVFEDLGFSKEEAKKLMEESDTRLKPLMDRAFDLIKDDLPTIDD